MKTIKNKHLWTSALVGAVIAGGALASNVTLPNVFQANTPARASEVNANFNAVKNAVDNNNARLGTVETSVATLQGATTTIQGNVSTLQTTLSTVQSSVATLQSADSQNWKRGGNTGTSSAVDYLGTADNQSLELRVNATRAMQIMPTGTSPTVVIGSTDCPAQIATGVKGAFVTGNAKGLLVACSSNTLERARVYDNNAALVGGYGNAAGSDDGDTTDSEMAAVVGGLFNSASGYASVVVGGESGEASGTYSATIGGIRNRATAVSAVAIGTQANAVHNNSIVISDGSVTTFSSGGADQFAVNARGGVYFGKGTTATATIPTGTFIATSTGASLSTGGTWTNSSDVALKSNLRPVDTKVVLDQLKDMPIYTWSYKHEVPTTRHIGPTAQDFAAKFAVGQDDKHIATIDADGVALAAVKGLAELVEEQRQLIDAQRKELDTLRSRVRALESKP